MKVSLLCVMIALGAISGAHASLASVYIAQSAAGSANGTSCSNADAVGFFNTSGNWGAASNQIGPGTIVYICGTITTNLTFQGSGASGGSKVCGYAATACTPVILDGSQPGALMESLLNIGQSYILVQNLTWQTGWSGGSNAVITTSRSSQGYITIQNCHIDVMNMAQYIFLGGGTHDVAILNNFMRLGTGTGTYPNYTGGSGFQSDGLDTEGAYNVLVQGNYMEMNIGSGDQSCSGCHDDISQVWASEGSTYNWIYRYNYFYQNSNPAKTNNLSMMMMESIGTGNWDVYANVFHCAQGGSSGNGIVFDSNTSGAVVHIYNNTVVENANGCNNLFNISGSGSFYLENNIIYSTDAGNALTGGETFTTRSYNLWYGSDIPSCSGFTGEICGSNPLFTNYSANDFTLQATAPAIGKGTNLSSPYNVALTPETTWPNPAAATVSSGTRDIGAYQQQAGTVPPGVPPTVTATIN